MSREYICEQCWHEQDNAGFCERCQALLNENITVTALDELAKGYKSPDEDFQTYTNRKEKRKHSKAVKVDDSYAYGSDADWKAWSEKGYSSKAWTATPVKKWVPDPPAKKAKAWRNHNYWFIGDVHGNIAEYMKAVADIRAIDPDCITIQVGDLGVGEYDVPQLSENDLFIQGNHDNIDACMRHPNFMGKFGFRNGVFFMGGAKSNGYGFKGEELTEAELDAAIKLYCQVKPEIVVTHDCPSSVRKELGLGWDKPADSATVTALDTMLAVHAPNVWAFGHYHNGRNRCIEGTNYLALDCLESHQIRLAWSTGVVEFQKASKPMEMSKTQAVTKFVKGLFGR